MLDNRTMADINVSHEMRPVFVNHLWHFSKYMVSWIWKRKRKEQCFSFFKIHVFRVFFHLISIFVNVSFFCVVKPFLIRGPQNQTAVVGNSVTFQCRVGGEPVPDVLCKYLCVFVVISIVALIWSPVNNFNLNLYSN